MTDLVLGLALFGGAMFGFGAMLGAFRWEKR